MSDHFVPYGRQIIDQDDIDAVTGVLRGDWLTTGPMVGQFEEAFAEFVEAEHGVACSNGTAALHLAMLAADIGPDDEVIVAALTFAASANCVRYVGGTVVFADVREDTLTIDVDHVRSLITPATKAIVAVDYAGTPCDMDELMALADEHDLIVVSDACHGPGSVYKGRRVGGIAHMSTWSFHPVKHLTTAEGGMVTTNDPVMSARLKKLRNHGIETDFRQREEKGTWEYDVSELGYNYRLPDLNCALGLSQVAKLPGFLARRRELVKRYDELFAEMDGIRSIDVPDDREGGWHLYPIRFETADPSATRARAFDHLRANNIGVIVHYKPVYLHSYYAGLGYEPGLCPVSEAAYEGLLSIPMWPALQEADQDRVVDLLVEVLEGE